MNHLEAGALGNPTLAGKSSQPISLAADSHPQTRWREQRSKQGRERVAYIGKDIEGIEGVVSD